MKKTDIQQVAEAAKSSGLAILERWLPGGKRQGSDYVVLNPHRDDKHLGNLRINIESGLGKDFGEPGSKGFKDFVDVVAFAVQCKPGEAAEALVEFLRLPAAAAVPPAPTSAKAKQNWRVITPVPKDTPPPPAHYKLGKPDVVYIYRDAEGHHDGEVCRWNATPERRKEYHPRTWCEDSAGRREWRWQSWAVPRPLYGRDLLADKPDATVFVHEGEKAADAGGELLLPFVSICWPNGAASADKADFGPLAGRDVVLWPDHDEPGTQAALTAAKAIRKAGAKRVRFVNLDLFAKHAVSAKGQIVDRLTPLPAGWDCADALAEGWTPQALAELLLRDDALLDELVVEQPRSHEERSVVPDENHTSGPYQLDAELGLFYVETDREGKVRQSRICAPCKVVALARDTEGGAWSPVIEFRDRDGQQRREVIPFRLFVGDGHDGVKQLVDLGLEVASGRQALDRLKAYIVASHPDRRARLADQTGWHGRAFLLPEGAIGETDETLLFRGNRRTAGLYATRGKLTDWQTYIGHPAIGNPRLMFSLSVAFAGPLLKPLGMSGFAFHWTGDSSTGKTGALHAAASAWGNPDDYVHSWRQTSNALEYTCAQHNDVLLANDELRELDAKEAGAVAYMQGNGKGKSRAHHAGGLRDAVQWRIVMMSSGEIGLADHIASAGQKHYAGQEVRFVELDADGGAGLGMWNNVVGCPGGGKQFTDHLKKFAGRYHGTPGRAFLAELVKHPDELPGWWRFHEGEFVRRYRPQNAGGQVLRVMNAFCLVAFAGEVAARFAVVPWERGAATDAAGLLFEQWTRARPTQGNAEDMQILRHVRGLMERSWKSRFDDWARIEQAGTDISRVNQVIEPLGFRKTDAGTGEFLFYVMRGRFEEEFARKAGFKPRRVAAVLKHHGVLRCDEDGTTWRETLPNDDPRSYCIIGKKLWALEI